MNAEIGTRGVIRGDFSEERWYHRKFNPLLVQRSGEDNGRRVKTRQEIDPGPGPWGESGQLFLQLGDGGRSSWKLQELLPRRR